MIPLPPSEDISRISDWIELFVLVENKSIAKSKVTSLLNKEFKVDEDDIDSAFQELGRRLLLYGYLSPFSIKGNVVTPLFSWGNMPEHALCLYYSTYGAGKPTNGTQLFEELTKACIERSLAGVGYRFGFPAKRSFKQQLDDFAAAIHQRRHEDPMPHDKDRDVDIVTSIEFDDMRDNQILVFTQCAAGKNWDTKKAVAVESYKRYVSFTWKSVVSSLSVTQIIDMDEWRNACDDYGLILDRARLYRIYSVEKSLLDTGTKKLFKNWCKEEL